MLRTTCRLRLAPHRFVTSRVVAASASSRLSSSSLSSYSFSVATTSAAIPVTSFRGFLSSSPTRILLDSASSSSSSSNDSSSSSDQKQQVILPSWTDPSSKNLYTRLGLRSGAAVDDIKRHYRHLAKKYHPDNQSNLDEKSKEQAVEKFRLVKEAYETLSNSDKRNVYNMTGASSSQQDQAFQSGQNPYAGAQNMNFSMFGRGLHGRYNVRYDTESGGRPVVEMPRWGWFILFFSIGLVIGAWNDLRTRKKKNKDEKETRDKMEATDPNFETFIGGSQEVIEQQRSSMLRPFVAILLMVSFLPRLPAAGLAWYFYVYKPTVEAEDRSVLDNVTVVMKEEMDGKAVNLSLRSPFFAYLAQKEQEARKSTKNLSEEYLFVVTMKALNSAEEDARIKREQEQEKQNQPEEDKKNDEQKDQQQQQRPVAQVEEEALMPLIEYPCGRTNVWNMSIPRPVTKDGKGKVLPGLATLKVKKVVRDGSGKIDQEKGQVIFERHVRV